MISNNIIKRLIRSNHYIYIREGDTYKLNLFIIYKPSKRRESQKKIKKTGYKNYNNKYRNFLSDFNQNSETITYYLSTSNISNYITNNNYLSSTLLKTSMEVDILLLVHILLLV